MTVLTRWEPFRELSTLQDRINRAFRESYREGGQDESLATSTFAPAVDVYEDEHNVTLKIEVPGIDEKDISVSLENNTLTVHGERKIEKEEGRELPPCGEPVWQLHPHLQSAPHRGFRESFGNLRQGRIEGHAAQKGGSQAQADQGQPRRGQSGEREDARSQGPQQSRISLYCVEPGLRPGRRVQLDGLQSTGGGRNLAAFRFRCSAALL